MREIRAHLAAGTFGDYRREFSPTTSRPDASWRPGF